MHIDTRLQEIGKLFRLEGTYLKSTQLTIGNVNQTYKITYKKIDGSLNSYIAQRINTYAFHYPEQLMKNADKITEHIRSKNAGGISLHFHHTADRKTFVYDEEGGFWRVSNYIPSITYSTCTNKKLLREAGRAFGQFQRDLADFDASLLFETIPNFHNTPMRLKSLFESTCIDPYSLAIKVQNELNFIDSVKRLVCEIAEMERRGELPVRVTHNDTKINNVLFDINTNKALTIIDLDTVMPGVIAYDFGDAVRFAANYVSEDCKEFEKAGCNLELFEAFTEGFLSKTHDILTPKEIETLPLSVFTITIELAARFLEDYILGNKYFRIEYSEHNLIRARCQLQLAKDVYNKFTEMNSIIQKYL